MNKKNIEKKNETKESNIEKTIKPQKIVKKIKKIKKNITSGIAYVQATFNNTIVSITDDSGNVIAWSSAGSKGFKGSRKSTPYAAQIAADTGSGRETALRALQSRGFKILSIKDVTPMAHNGARPPKKRRV